MKQIKAPSLQISITKNKKNEFLRKWLILIFIFLKKSITISFLLLLFVSQVSYYLFYKPQQYQIEESVKQEIFSKITESSLEIINAIAHKIDIEPDAQYKNFYQHGQIYEGVFSKTINGNKLTHFLNDIKKDDLLKRFSIAEDSANEQNSNNIKPNIF